MGIATFQAPPVRVDADRLITNISTLARFGLDDQGVRHRVSFSPSYEAARQWLAEVMTDCGMVVRNDAAGNLIGRIGPVGPAIMCGSHFDTVPGGGPLDGALGVLAGIACAETLSSHTDLPVALEVVGFADEEGYFGQFSGSAAMVDGLAADDLLPAERLALSTAMQEAGFSISAMPAAHRSLGEILAYIELHIEQGPVLEMAGVPIGIVDVIVGVNRRDLIFAGDARHAGTTPMSERRDALVAAAAHVQSAVEQISKIGGPEARITFGMLDIRPSATNVIPGEATLRQEIRHPDPRKLDLLKEWSAELASSAAERWRCKLTMVEQGGKPPVAMNGCIRRAITDAAADLGLATLTLPSGAGHDAQVLGARLPSGMIFVPSAGGRSHCPDEYTEPALIENGANVLLCALARLIADRHELRRLHAGSR